MPDNKPYTRKSALPVPHELGKLQPQAIDLEEAVLGAVMLEKNAFTDINDILYPEAFYMEQHQYIYKAIIDLYAKSIPIDILTVTNELKRTDLLDKVGGPYYITQLTNRVASAAHVVFHARIIIQKFVARELIRISTNNVKQAYDDSNDAFDLIDKSYTALNSLTNKIIRTPAKGSKILFTQYIKKLEVILNATSELTGVPTTINAINRITGGWQNSDLIILAARPGMGKTAMIKAIANAAMDVLQKPVLVDSIEMSADQLISRFISEDTQVNSQHFNSKRFMDSTNFNQINSAITRYFDKDHKDLLIIDDTAAMTINELRARAKRIHAEHGICCLIIDYLQMVKSTHENKTYEIEEVCAGLKALAKELNIPIIALSQLNRECEKRSPPRPILSDLRSSGAIEQYADVVCFLYRPEYYGIMELDDGESSFQYTEFIIAKHRNGALATVPMRFIDYLTKFQNWEEEHKPVTATPAAYNPNAGLNPSKEWDAPF